MQNLFKKCENCEQVKPLVDFYQSHGSFMSVCKECHKARVHRSKQIRKETNRMAQTMAQQTMLVTPAEEPNLAEQLASLINKMVKDAVSAEIAKISSNTPLAA